MNQPKGGAAVAVADWDVYPSWDGDDGGCEDIFDTMKKIGPR
jgi:hypothetical protein